MKPVERLEWYIKHKKIKYTALENDTKLVHGYLSKQIRSLASIGSDILEKICNACPDLNPAWLLTGKGNWQLGATGMDKQPEHKTINPEEIKNAALEHLKFIDCLNLTGEEKYVLCKQFAEKLAYQVYFPKENIAGKKEGHE
jgi:hypothetical protein